MPRYGTAPWVAKQPHLSLAAWQVRLFSHLSQYEREGSLTAAAVAKGTIHRSVLGLGLQVTSPLPRPPAHTVPREVPRRAAPRRTPRCAAPRDGGWRAEGVT